MRKTEYAYLKLLLNHTEFQKMINKVKLLNFHSFSTVYSLHYYDKQFKNYDLNIARYITKKFTIGSSLTFTKKFVASLKAVQNTMFFWAEILRIEILTFHDVL